MAERRFLAMNQSFGYPEEHDPTADTITLAGLTMGGNIALGGNKVTGSGVPTDPNDLTTKTYVDGIATGLIWQDPVLTLEVISDAAQGGSPPGSPAAGDAYVVNTWGAGYTDGDIVQYDGASWVVILDEGGTGEPANGTRVVVTGGTAAGSFATHENEIATYNSVTDTWSFETPANSWAALVDGSDAGGGYWEGTTWTYDGTGTEWIMFGGAGQISAGAGLTLDGNTMNAGAGDGIEVTADHIHVELHGTTPGLEFDGVTPNGLLRVMTDGAHGVVCGASGVEVEIDTTPDTLKVDANGLGVTGLPSSFKVNDIAVGADVTSANLDTLTDGSNADALHTHLVAATDEAKRIEDTHTNNTAVTTSRAVRWSATNGEITHADNSTEAGARCIGVARVGGAGSPGTSEVVKQGVCAGCLSGASVNIPYFLGANGAIVEFASIPVPGRVIRLGFASNTADLDVNIQELGLKRA